eukprot:TRINITY_DN54681_c0_g1_i1.p1 TRINITY_DN54681_c0_g1~~TRINITY_DN54681_c0_g1_i1.p1  ORF type:complete len:1187 (-),score=154.71 TRINITY_DN54681_c0_g1_i1:9-3569(-)
MSRRRYTREQLLDLSDQPSSKAKPQLLPAEVEVNRIPLAITWTARPDGKENFALTDWSSAAPRSPEPEGVRKYQSAFHSPKQRVLPIAQYQISDQRRPATTPSSCDSSNASPLPSLSPDRGDFYRVSPVPAPVPLLPGVTSFSPTPRAASPSSGPSPSDSPVQSADNSHRSSPVPEPGPMDASRVLPFSACTPFLSSGLFGSLEVDNQGHYKAPFSSVLAAAPTPTFHPVKPNTNLNLPPPNWLTEDWRVGKQNPGAPTPDPNQREFSSATLAIAATKLLLEGAAQRGRGPSPTGPIQGVDVIAPADKLKKLFMAPFTSSPLAMTIHKIGQSLVLEGEVMRETKKNKRRVRDQHMLSKLLYYSILAEGNEGPEPGTGDSSMQTSGTATPEPPEPATSQALVVPPSPTPRTPPSHNFSRTLHWRFQDLNLLLGTDALVMRMPQTQGEICVRMRDTAVPIDQQEALDCWLDNIMTNVPNVAICFHKEGILQGYQVINTNHLPVLSERTRFDPTVVEDHAGSVLHWLKDKCTRDAGSYLLVRDKENQLQLYDLSELYEANPDPANHPFAYSVGMMCYRMALKLCDSREAQDQNRARSLLLKSIDLLREEDDPVVLATAHEQIAQTYLFVEPEITKSKQGKTEKRKERHELPKPPAVGSLVIYDARRESNQQAIDHLTKSMKILASYPGYGCDSPAIRRMQEQQITCYIDLARIESMNCQLPETIRWLNLASAIVEDLQKRPVVPESEMSPVDLHCGLLLTLAEVYLGISGKLQESPVDNELLKQIEVGLEKLRSEPVPVAPVVTVDELVPFSHDSKTWLLRAVAAFEIASRFPGQKAQTARRKAVATRAEIARLHQCREQWEDALRLWSECLAEFAELEDFANVVIMKNNIGKYYLQRADSIRQTACVVTDAEKQPLLAEKRVGDIGREEEDAYYDAIRTFQSALDILDNHLADPQCAPLRTLTYTNVALASHKFGARLRANFVALLHRSSLDVEQHIAKHFLRAMKMYELANRPDQVAAVQCSVASVYTQAVQHGYVTPEKVTSLSEANERRNKMGSLYWRKAFAYYSSTGNQNMAAVAATGLAELHLALAEGESKSARAQCEKAVACILRLKPWMVSTAIDAQRQQLISDRLKQCLTGLLKAYKQGSPAHAQAKAAFLVLLKEGPGAALDSLQGIPSVQAAVHEALS